MSARRRGTIIPALIPGSEPWLRNMSASKVAAVLGLSPYDSPFSLWHKMHGPYTPEEQTAAHSRGHFLEPAIAAWWQSKHPDVEVEPGRCWQHHDLPWYTASPDRLTSTDAVLELKSAADMDGWGKPGTDEIPVGYRAQVMAQMDVVGVDTAHVAVLTAYLEFREYVVHYDATEAQFIRAECAAFMESLRSGRQPDLDSSTHTYETVRSLHPNIDRDLTTELPDAEGRDYIDTWHDLNHANAAHSLARTRVLALMGDTQKATYKGLTLATRQAKGGGIPFLKTALKESA